MKTFKHLNARSIAEASAALAGSGVMVNSGGTDLVGTLRDSVLPDEMYPATVIDLKKITPSMDYIKEEGSLLKIGALTRLEDIAESQVVQSKYTALAQAASKTASPHIREMGTIGGNICQLVRCWYFRRPNNFFYCLRKGGNMCYAMIGDNRYHSIFGAVQACIAVNPSDTAPALVALNATIVTNKREIAADDFWTVAIPGSTVLDEDEIVTEIQVLEPTGKSAFLKFANRKSIDFPVVNCATSIVNGEARICLNAVSPNPHRCTDAEESIAGKTINEANAEAAAEAAVGNATAMPAVGINPGSKWKISVAKALVKRTILACA